MESRFGTFAGFMRKLGYALVLAVCTAAPAALPGETAPPRTPSAPRGFNLHGAGGTSTSSTWLSFDCSFVIAGEPLWFDYRKVTCRFATTGIARPTTEQVLERLRAMDEPATQQQLRALFPERCKALAASDPAAQAKAAQSAELIFREKLSAACAANDLAQALEAFRYEVKEIWAHTCEAFNYGSHEYDFEKVDEYTWRAVDRHSRGTTGSIKTIWRARGSNEFGPWNFKQVTSANPNCAPVPPIVECPKDATEEWTAEISPTLTSCSSFK